MASSSAVKPPYSLLILRGPEDAETTNIEDLVMQHHSFACSRAWKECPPRSTTSTWDHRYFESFQAEVATRLDLEDWMVWQGVHTLADNRDTFTKNYYLYFDPDLPESGFRIISWDADATWGINWDSMIVEPTTMAINGHDPFSGRILGIEGYRIPYVSRYEERVESVSGAEADVLAGMEEQHRRFAPFITRDLAHWDRDMDVEALHNALRAAIVTRFEVMRGVVSTAR